MPLSSHDVSAGIFIRGLSNLNAQLWKAEAHVAAMGSHEAELLGARLVADGGVPGASYPAADLHGYTLGGHVLWAAEGAKLAIAQLLAEPAVPAANDPKSVSDLRQRLDATIAYLKEIAPGELEAGFDRTIVIEHRRGSASSSGGHFLVAFAIPHFFYHVTTAYGILRNQGVQLTMGDFLGNWSTGQSE